MYALDTYLINIFASNGPIHPCLTKHPACPHRALHARLPARPPCLNETTKQEHITERLLPVKDRMLAQLAQRSGDNDHKNSTTTATNATEIKTDTVVVSSGNLNLGDATAVSDGWMGSASSSDGGLNDGGITDGSMTDRELSNTSMARPCSSLSLADLGDLCGDREADDCGGAFLVGGDCDDVGGPGIGLELYDLGQVRILSVVTLAVVVVGEPGGLLQLFFWSALCCVVFAMFFVIRVTSLWLLMDCVISGSVSSRFAVLVGFVFFF